MVQIHEENGQLVIRIGGEEYARYQFGAALWKPYLYPLRAANGLSLLADAPTDHRHHHGFWVGHARVDETDCWLERHNSGRIRHVGFDSITEGEQGSFTEHCAWSDPNGRIVLQDTRTFTFYDLPAEGRWFDFELVLAAPGSNPVRLYPTNEAGLPHLRMADGLTPKSGGTLTNAEGKHNERGTYRQRSHWLDSSGKLGRLACGVALFDHPENPEFPTPWFTRDYGPFTPNYGLFREDPIEILPGRPLRLRYRLYSHTGDVVEGHVQEAWETYFAEVNGGRPVEGTTGRPELAIR